MIEAADMDSRYARNVPALTEAECALLRTKQVAVIGCGGLGGHLVENLARIGVGSIRVVDGDVFEESNLNRQILAEISLLGAGKAEAAAARIQRINPDVKAEAIHAFLDEANAAKLIAGCDAVLDGLDSIPARIVLARACGEAGIPCIYGAISGWVAQAAIALPGDSLLVRLYAEAVELRDSSALSFTPALCAAMQSALCVKLLVGRPVKTGTLFYFDLLHQEFDESPLL